VSERTWVPEAEGSGFGLENLPYGAVAPPGGEAQVAVRIGDHALRLGVLEEAGLLARAGLPEGTLSGPLLNPLLALGRPAWSSLRECLREMLADGMPGRAGV
jgi:fumarylacetoacetase